MDIRFLIDEHLRGQLWQALLWHNQQGVCSLDVVRVGDPPDLPQAHRSRPSAPARQVAGSVPFHSTAPATCRLPLQAVLVLR